MKKESENAVDTKQNADGIKQNNKREKDKEGCGGAVWTDLEVPAGIDRKDHVETCRVDEHMAYID
ncbi:hypothetical protein T05_1527 [Trichinella murrelli]|uniref:Uncharacterized protein n=1 Tax=Trichinella murrelli TaxID=144512 RepID=A0A0V0T986_9BILA|nr:hypothetical protein T05_1527 [Trichinella murrelli]